MNSNIEQNNSPFQNRTWVKLFLAQIISLAGSGISTIALALLVWQLAGNKAGEVLGTALALKMIAYVFIAPIVGSFSHKIQQRRWLIGMDLVRAAVVLFLPFITTAWQIYLLLLFINVFSAGFTPVYQATISDIIKDKEQYTKALSYSRLAYNLEQLLSPTIAAFMLAIMDFSWLFILDSISFLISALLLVSTALPYTAKTIHSEKTWDNLKFGISAFFKTPRLRALFICYIAVASTSAIIITGTVVYVGEILKRGESRVAIAMAVSGCGSMITAFILPKILKKIAIPSILTAGVLVLSSGLFAASFEPDWLFFLLIWFCLGIGLTFIELPASVLVRMSCNPEDTVRYFSANFSLSHLCWLVAYPLSGFLGSHLGMANTFFIIGIIVSITGFAGWKIYPRPDLEEIKHAHDMMRHKHSFTVDDPHHSHLDSETARKGNSFHEHHPVRHSHKFVIDIHHMQWPDGKRRRSPSA